MAGLKNNRQKDERKIDSDKQRGRDTRKPEGRKESRTKECD